MKTSDFLIFFSLVLAVHLLVNFYIFLRGFQALPSGGYYRTAYGLVFWCLALSYIAGRVLERATICKISTLLIWAGSFWLGLMLYLLLAVILVDLLRLANHFFGFFPEIITRNYAAARLACAGTVLLVSVIVIAAGHVNTLHPRVRTLDLDLPGNKGPLPGLNVVLATDIHLGLIIRNSRLETLVDTVNGLDPDVVLLGGDIIDEDLGPVIAMNLGETLVRLRARHGVYAVTGNHEYIGGVERACSYLREHGITVLRDEAVTVGGAVCLAGREDISFRHTGRDRRSVEELIRSCPGDLPVILMDHQPFRLEEAVKAGVALQVSGHTHNGQLWPFNHIVAGIYTVARGYRRIGETHFYVSSGFGTWGPPVRVGSRPEIVLIRIRFTGNR